MDDLDELASAARQAPLTHRAANPKKSNRSTLRIAAISLACIGLLTIVCWPVRGRLFGNSDPRFSIKAESVDDGWWRWWTIVNEDSEPLTVNSVMLNGEFAAPPAVWIGSRPEPALAPPIDPEHAAGLRPLPRTISVGERLYLMEYRTGLDVANYSKQVVFVDIDTDRGKFRYQNGKLMAE